MRLVSVAIGRKRLFQKSKWQSRDGMPLPAIVLRRKDGTLETLRTFGYSDFKCRL